MATLVLAGILGIAGAATPAAADAPSHLAAARSAPTSLDPEVIQRAAGMEPTTTPDGVVRLSWPRQEVAVMVDGVALRPAAGLTSWAAFAPVPSGALMMGDTVVFEDEVDAAMDAAFANGLEVSALHNHFFFDRPKVYFMHVGGRGEPARLASGVKAVWDAIRAVRRGAPTPSEGFGGATPASGAFDAPAIERLVGHPAAVQDGVVKVTIGREGALHGVRVGGSMGLTTWIAFSGSDALAAADGDLILSAGEVQPVLRSLRRASFHVVALHNHMIGESPTYYFTHFWAKGPAGDLARGFRAVLDSQAAAALEEGD
jgi:hypothetical protein